MIETLSVFQWSILVLSALCIGMSKTGVQEIAEPSDAPRNRHRCLARNPHGEALS